MAKTGNVINLIIIIIILYVEQKIFYDYIYVYMDIYVYIVTKYNRWIYTCTYISICYLAIYVSFTKAVGIETYKKVIFSFIHGLQTSIFETLTSEGQISNKFF